MADDPSIRYSLIQSNKDMRQALERIRSFKSLAVDFEMENNYHHYGLHVALIQISTPEKDTYIFDPLSEINVLPIGELFSDSSIEIVVHDIEFDKRACFQVYGWTFRNIFDTKIAAQFCGYRKFGLGYLLEELLSVKTNKRFQRIDWLKRPLRQDALDYAATETSFLHALKDILKDKLVETGHLEWAREEFQYHEKEVHVEMVAPYLKVRRQSALTPRQTAILKYLAEFRENIARKVNRPVQFVIKDKLLVEICQSPPRDVAAIKSIKSMHPAIYKDENSVEFLKAVQKGLEAPEIPSNAVGKRVSRANERPLKAMQLWRAAFARAHNIDPYLMLSNEVLKWAAKHGNSAVVPEEISDQVKQWQRNLIWPSFAEKFRLPELSS